MSQKKYDLYTHLIKPCLARLNAYKLDRGLPTKITFKSAHMVEYLFSDGFRFFINYQGGCMGTSETRYSDANYTIDIDHDANTNTAFFRVTKDGSQTTLFKVREDGTIELGAHVKIDPDGDLTIDDVAVATEDYVDDEGSLWEVDGSETQLKTADDLNIRDQKLLNVDGLRGVSGRVEYYDSSGNLGGAIKAY